MRFSVSPSLPPQQVAMVAAGVAERFNVNATLSPLTAVWTIPHFSGYLVATGRSGE